MESFHSFYCRLAMANGLSVHQLEEVIRRLRARSADYSGFDDSNTAQRSLDLRTVVGFAGTLSGNSELTRLTLLSFSTNDKTVRQSSLRTTRAWCEQCFQDDLRLERPAFDRLIWSSRFMMRCPFHRLILRTACPTCRKPQRIYRGRILDSKVDLARCAYCRSSLVGSHIDKQPEFKPFFGEVELLEIVESIASGGLTSTSSTCLQIFYGAIREYGLQQQITDRSNELNPRIAPWALPTLANIVATACRYQVSAVTLLLTPEQAAEQVNRFVFDEHHVPGRARIKVEALLLQSIRMALEEGLLAAPEDPIPTLAQVGSLFSMRDLSFTKSFPELSQQYLERTRRQAAQFFEIVSE